MNFLSELYQKELSYSAINTARAALSTVIHPPEGCTFGHHPLVARFLKGVFTARPALPRYQEVWDVSVVLKYLKSLHPPEQLSLKDLTLKMTMLIALLSGQRCQTIHALDTTTMVLSADKCVFYIYELLKTSRPGKHYGCLELRAYADDKQLCVVNLLQEYVQRTVKFRGTNAQLLLSYHKLHNPVSTATIGRWLKEVLKRAGIDIQKFSAHSTRSASVSAAKTLNISVKTILDAAGWSNADTFAKFYDRPVISDECSDNYDYCLLKALDSQ